MSFFKKIRRAVAENKAVNWIINCRYSERGFFKKYPESIIFFDFLNPIS